MDFFRNYKELEMADKVQLIISYILQVILALSVIYLSYKGDFLNAVLVLGIFLLTFIPSLVRKSYEVHLPVEFDLIPILFIFLALYLGEIQSYYAKYWWWDIVLHTSSGFLLGTLGFVLIYVLNEEKKINLLLNPRFLCLFAFAFAVAMGAIWEIFEFSVDAIVGTQMQHASLVDTMWDLIVDTVGALVISFIGYFYVKQRGFLLFDRVVHRMVEKNPQLFRKRHIREKIKLSRDKLKATLRVSKHRLTSKLKNSKDRLKGKFKRKKI